MAGGGGGGGVVKSIQNPSWRQRTRRVSPALGQGTSGIFGQVGALDRSVDAEVTVQNGVGQCALPLTPSWSNSPPLGKKKLSNLRWSSGGGGGVSGGTLGLAIQVPHDQWSSSPCTHHGQRNLKFKTYVQRVVKSHVGRDLQPHNLANQTYVSLTLSRHILLATFSAWSPGTDCAMAACGKSGILLKYS